MQHTWSNNINPLLKRVLVSCSLRWPKTLKRDFLQTASVCDNKEEADNLFINLLRVFHHDISFGINKHKERAPFLIYCYILRDVVKVRNNTGEIRTGEHRATKFC